jgi:glucose-1-phosphate adenylyltransferase
VPNAVKAATENYPAARESVTQLGEAHAATLGVSVAD